MRILLQALAQTYATLLHYLPFLTVGVLLAAAVQVYVDREKLTRFLRRAAAPSIFLVTLVGALTPFCSCGTMAVVLSMMASTVPWGPVVAFMVSSPLMSPSEFVYTAGLMGWGFAVALLVSSVLLGVGAGYAAHLLERAGFLKGQARLREESAAPAEPAACACGDEAPRRPGGRLRLGELGRAALGFVPRILGLYLSFSLVGHILTALLPSEWLLGLFGRSKLYAIPLAATVGLPLYINAEVSMPLIRSFKVGGMSQGAALALIIAGAGTSIGAISGAFVIARRRVVGLTVAMLWAGAVLAGYIYNLILVMHPSP